MAAAWKWYDKFALNLAKKFIDFVGDPFFMMIADNGYVPDHANDEFQSNVTNEVTGTGYTAGGQVLVGQVITLIGRDSYFIANNLTWSTVTFTNGRYGIIYDAAGGSPSTNFLVGYVDFGANFSPAGSNFGITWNASGIFYLHPVD